MEFVNWNKLNKTLTGIGREFHAATKLSKSEKAERRAMISALKMLADHLNIEYYSGSLDFYTTGSAASFRTYRSNIAGAVLNAKRFGDLLVPTRDFYRIAQILAGDRPHFADRVGIILTHTEDCRINERADNLNKISVSDGLLPTRHRGRQKSACKTPLQDFALIFGA